MAEVSRPAVGNGRAVSDAEYEALVAGYSEDGLTDGTPSGDAPVYGDGSNLAVKVQPNRWAVLRGYQWYTDSAGSTVAITANSGSARTDLVVLRLNRSDWTVRVAVVQGTPGAGAPSPTRQTGDTGVYEIPLAEVDVPTGAGSIPANAVRRREWYLSRNGTILCTAATMPPASPGRRVFQTDTVRMLVATSYADNSWQVTTEDTGWVQIPVTNTGWKNNVGAQPMIRRMNGMVTLRPGELERATTLLANNTSPIYDIPAGFRSSLYQSVGAYQDGSHECDVVIVPPGGSPNPNYVLVRGHATAIAAGSSLRMHTITYPADA